MKLKRTAPVVSGVLIYLVIGLIYAWSIFVKPLEAEFGWSRTQTAATFTISMICFIFGGILGSVILKTRSSQFAIRLSASLLFTGFLLASRVENILSLYIAYGVFCGLGVGLSYITTLSTVTKWYPDKIGFISGVLLMGFGLGALIFGTFASILIESTGWRTTFVVLGVLFAIILTICSIWIVPPKYSASLPQTKQNFTETMETDKSFTTLEMIKRPSFQLYFTWTTLMVTAGLAVIGHAALCAQDLGATVATSTLFTGIISLSNGFGRVIAGLIYDSFGRKICTRFDNLMMILALTLLVYSVYSSNILIFFVGGILIGISYGMIPATNPAYATSFYGSINFASNLSIINAHVIPAALLGPLVAGNIRTVTGTYLPSFVLLLCLVIIAFILQFFIKKP